MSFLIKNCQLLQRPQPVDVRLRGRSISEIGRGLVETAEDTVIEARGGLLLPGLHDHHIHLMSTAASLESVHCGPPHIEDSQQLEALLQRENQRGGQLWLRGIGYHMSIAGEIDRHWLDRFIPGRPAKIQHRGGRLWILNTCALEELGLLEISPQDDVPPGVEYDGKWSTGRLYECDQWLRSRQNSRPPDLSVASQQLARHGVTGITDTTPHNGPDEWAHFHQSQVKGRLRQRARMMGGRGLPLNQDSHLLQSGEYKIHLIDSNLPDLDELIATVREVHETARAVAIHCVTHAELVYALACLKASGTITGDRIEHASVTLPDMQADIAELGLRVISQPHFIQERGDRYLREVDAREHASLYRLRSFITAGIPLAAGSDAPFGSVNPWRSMQAAVTRLTLKGAVIGKEEGLTPEMALALYTSSPEAPGVLPREVNIGSEADLCLLDAPWEQVRGALAEATVTATWVMGKLVYQEV